MQLPKPKEDYKVRNDYWLKKQKISSDLIMQDQVKNLQTTIYSRVF